ncbi:hypothetical protein ASPZODRAFT_38217, partial [Penicilliopsis zonata CBS 506.65]
TREAVEQALKDNDIQSVFFLTLIDQDKTSDLADLAAAFNATVYYWSTRTEATVQQKVKEGALPDDTSLESALTRNTYRTRLFDAQFKSSPWLAVNSVGFTSISFKDDEDYYTLKASAKDAVQKSLTSSTPREGVSDRLETVSNAIAEII